jgi:hypothetical protein
MSLAARPPVTLTESVTGSVGESRAIDSETLVDDTAQASTQASDPGRDQLLR